MMRPPCGSWLFIMRKACCAHRNEPVKLTATTFDHCSKVKLLERNSTRADAGVVEQQVDAAVGLFDTIEQRGDRRRVGDVGRHDHCCRRRRPRHRRGLFEHVAAPARQDHSEPGLDQCQRRGAADAASSSGDDGDFSRRCHDSFLSAYNFCGQTFRLGAMSSSCAATSASSPPPALHCRLEHAPNRGDGNCERLGQRFALQQPAEKECGSRIAATSGLDRKARGFRGPDAFGSGGDDGEPVGRRFEAGDKHDARSAPAQRLGCRPGFRDGADRFAGQPFEFEAVGRDDIGDGERAVTVEFGDACADIPSRPDVAHDRIAAI